MNVSVGREGPEGHLQKEEKDGASLDSTVRPTPHRCSKSFNPELGSLITKKHLIHSSFIHLFICAATFVELCSEPGTVPAEY